MARVSVEFDSRGSNKIEADQAKQAAAAIKTEHAEKKRADAAVEAGKKISEALKKEIADRKELEQQMSRTRRAMMAGSKDDWTRDDALDNMRKINEEQKKVAAGAKVTGTEMGNAYVATGQKVDVLAAKHKSFLSEARIGVRELVRVWAGFGVAGVVIKAVMAEFAKFQAEYEKFGEKNKSQEQYLAKLSQLAISGDPKTIGERTAKLMRDVNTFYAMRGANDEAGAAKAIYTLESYGMNTPENLKTLAGLNNILEGNMGDVAASVSTLLKNFPNNKDTLRQVISKALIAQQPAPGTATEIIQATADVAPIAGQLGLSSDEVMAAISSVAQRAGSSKEAGDWMKHYLKSFTREGMIEGKSPAEQLDWLTSLDLPAARYAELLSPQTVAGLNQWASTAVGRKGRSPGGIDRKLTYRGADLKEILKGLSSEGLTTEQLNERIPGLLDSLVADIGTFGDSFKGKSLAEIEKQASSLFQTDAQWMKFFGERIQAIQFRFGYRESQTPQTSPSGYVYSNPKMLAALQASNATDLVSEVEKANALQPQTFAAKEVGLANAAVNIAGQPFGTQQNIVESVIQRAYAKDLEATRLRGGIVKQDIAKKIEELGGPDAAMIAKATNEEMIPYLQVISAMPAQGGPLQIRPELNAPLLSGLEAAKKADDQRFINRPISSNVMAGGGGVPATDGARFGPGVKDYLNAARTQGFKGLEELISKSPGNTMRVKDEESVGLLKEISDTLKKNVEKAQNAPVQASGASVLPSFDLSRFEKPDRLEVFFGKAIDKLVDNIALSFRTREEITSLSDSKKHPKATSQFVMPPLETLTGIGNFIPPPIETLLPNEFIPPPLDTLLPSEKVMQRQYFPTHGRFAIAPGKLDHFGRAVLQSDRDAGLGIPFRDHFSGNAGSVDHFGRRKYLADREQEEYEPGHIRRSSEAIFASFGQHSSKESRERILRSKDELVAAGNKLTVNDPEATPLLKRAVDALETLVASAQGSQRPQTYEGGFRRTTTNRAPSPIYRER